MSEVIRARRAPVRPGVVARWLVAIVFCLIAIVPIWWMINVVFSNAGEALSLSPRLWPTSLSGGIANIGEVLGDGVYVRSFLNSILYAGLTMLLVLAFASAAAFEFAHHEFPGRRALYIACLLGLMVPLAVIVIPAQRIVFALGWINTIQGIVVPSTASAFALFLLTEYMRTVPKELLEAARVDGASHVGIYWRIALPVARNGLVTVGILTFVLAWASYLWPLVVAPDPSAYPTSVAVAGYFQVGSKYPTSIVMTAALLSAIPVIVFYIIFNRLIVDGLSRSGLSG
jgi:multiple sugar transport system permease protein